MWTWYVIKVNDTTLGCEDDIGNTGSHTHYTVLDGPQDPMAETWTEVLDRPCVWTSGNTTESGAISDLTYELYNLGVTYLRGTFYT